MLIVVSMLFYFVLSTNWTVATYFSRYHKYNDYSQNVGFIYIIITQFSTAFFLTGKQHDKLERAGSCILTIFSIVQAVSINFRVRITKEKYVVCFSFL